MRILALSHRTILIVWILILTLMWFSVSPALAEPPNQTTISISTGKESRDELNWRGVSVGRYFQSISNSLIPERLRLLTLREDVDTSIKFSVARVNEDNLDKKRYDYALIPKIHRYISSQVFISGGMGLGYNELEDDPRNDEPLLLGGNLFFAPELSFGVDINTGDIQGVAEFSFTHRSNANIGNNNHGLNFFLFELGIKF